MPHEFSEIRSSQSCETAPEANPYASPGVPGPHLIPSATAIGIWRLNNALVMHRDAAMPPRCFRTNQLCDESEIRTYLGRSKLVNWLSRIAFLSLAYIGVAAVMLFRSVDPPNKWEAAGAILAHLLLAWLIAPAGDKGIRIVYYHSATSRRRQRHRSIAGYGLVTVGIALSFFYALYEPAWLSKDFVWAPILVIVSGCAIFVTTGLPFGVDHYQGPYVLVSGCCEEFIASFPECTIEFPQTAGTWIRRVLQAIG